MLPSHSPLQWTVQDADHPPDEAVEPSPTKHPKYSLQVPVCHIGIVVKIKQKASNLVKSVLSSSWSESDLLNFHNTPNQNVFLMSLMLVKVS